MSSTLAWSNRKLGIKTLNPIAIIKQNKHKFIYVKWNSREKILPTVL
jgi:hypothetical protein